MFSSSLPAPLFLVSRSCRSGTEKFTLTLTLNPQHLHSEEVSAANKSPCFALPSDTSSMLLRAKKSFALSLSLYLSCKLFRARRSQTKAHCRDCRSLSTSPWNRGSEMGLRHCQTRDIVMKAEDKKKHYFEAVHTQSASFRTVPDSPGQRMEFFRAKNIAFTNGSRSHTTWRRCLASGREKKLGARATIYT